MLGRRIMSVRTRHCAWLLLLTFLSISVLAVKFLIFCKKDYLNMPEIQAAQKPLTRRDGIDQESASYVTSRQDAVNHVEPTHRNFTRKTLNTGNDSHYQNMTLEDVFVPNIVHFVWFNVAERHMYFSEMISIQSAWKIQKPEKILIHCNFSPIGRWWDELSNRISIEIVPTPIPAVIGSYAIPSPQFASDIQKLLVLKQYGGIVMETDVVIVQSLRPLQIYNFTIGQEQSAKLSTSIILASRTSTFLTRLMTAIEGAPLSQPPVTIADIGTLAYTLHNKNMNLVHIEKESLSTPDPSKKHLVFTMNQSFRWWKSNLYVVHLHLSNNDAAVYNPEYIKELRNLIGQVLRQVYYGSADEISNYLPHILYSVSLPVSDTR